MARILIVDDNEANRLLAQSTLEDEGYEVILATCGAEAIAAFDTEIVDCIVLDVRMPGMDGFTVCERIRATSRGPETPVIFLTALRDIETFDRALRAGGDDFVSKPVRPTELIVRVQTALRLRSLRTELREHYDLLKKQRDDLMRLQLQKERLTAFVVHDLKNPVHAIYLHAELLLRNREIAKPARESAEQIGVEARQLTRMIMNLLDLSKADEGRLLPRSGEVVLASTVQEIFAELSVLASVHRVDLQSTIGDVRVHADPDLLRRTLCNLVENALRHAPLDTSVRVSAEATAAGLEIRVSDVGCGVPEEMRERVFDPFVQIDDAGDGAVTRMGRGLGLAFCKLAVVAHGGDIWIEDNSPGSIFCVRLPHES